MQTLTAKEIDALPAPSIDQYAEEQTVQFSGLTWRILFNFDNDLGAPWDFNDGHGPVRRSHYRHSMYNDRDKKKPGERPLNNADRNEWQFYYNWQLAIKKAKFEGWGTTEKPGDYVAAVQADFEHLRGWVRGEWHYISVHVQCVEFPHLAEGCCGVETLKNYHIKFAFSELLRPLARQAHEEMREAEYWQARGVVTC